MKQVLYLNAQREGYGIDQVRHTMTVGELIDYLAQFDEEARVYFKHDGGYTYGGITEWSIEDEEIDEEQ